MSVDVLTFGCRLNIYETEVMRREAAAAGLDDVVVVNTCAVTGEAVRQARQAIRRARRERPTTRIVVTGCAAQSEPATFAGMAEVDRVIGNAEKLQPTAWAATHTALTKTGDGLSGVAGADKVAVSDIMEARNASARLIEGLDGRVRAFVQVQNGCDHRCTFCVIPFGRGNSRSVAPDEVVAQVRRLVENGYREVVLTGVDLTSYGDNVAGAPRLGGLVKQILNSVTGLERLRLSSIDAVEVDRDFLDVFANDPRLMPHLHLSLQAGDDLILKRMKRRHSRADAIAFCRDLRQLRPDVAFGADLIAGFPTETEEMFQRSLDLVEDCGLTYLHVFPFSPRPGTPAARMPQVARDIVKDRARRLRERGEMALHAYLEGQFGTRHRVLVETNDVGRTEQFTPVQLGKPYDPGTIVNLAIRGHDGRHLLAA